jgi:hypothetical protein
VDILLVETKHICVFKKKKKKNCFGFTSRLPQSSVCDIYVFGCIEHPPHSCACQQYIGKSGRVDRVHIYYKRAYQSWAFNPCQNFINFTRQLPESSICNFYLLWCIQHSLNSHACQEYIASQLRSRKARICYERAYQSGAFHSQFTKSRNLIWSQLVACCRKQLLLLLTPALCTTLRDLATIDYVPMTQLLQASISNLHFDYTTVGKLTNLNCGGSRNIILRIIYNLYTTMRYMWRVCACSIMIQLVTELS